MADLKYKQGDNEGVLAQEDVPEVMNAIVTRGDGQTHYRTDVATPSVPPNGALVKIDYGGICHTDTSARDGKMQKMMGIANDGDEYRTLGHESAGRVVAVGTGRAANADLLGRNAVALALYGYCGKDTCQSDLTGKYNLCRQAVFPGVQRDGSLATYFMIEDAKFLALLPEVVSTKDAFPAGDALLTARHALNMISTTPQDFLGVWGAAGGLGLALLVNALAMGVPPEQMFAVDVRDGPLQTLQEKLGVRSYNTAGITVGKALRKESGYRLNKAVDAFGSGGKLSKVHKKMLTDFVSFEQGALIAAAEAYNQDGDPETLMEMAKVALTFMDKKAFQGMVREELTKGTVMDAYNSLIPGGALCVVGARFGEEIILPTIGFMGTEKAITGPWGGPFTVAEEVIRDIENGNLKPEHLELLRGKECAFTTEGMEEGFKALKEGEVMGRVYFNMKDS